MKKALSILLTLLCIALLALTAFAVPYGDVTEDAQDRYQNDSAGDEEGDFSFLFTDDSAAK